MPTPLETITDARFDCSISEAQYNNTVWLRAYNQIMHQCENEIALYLKDEWFLREADKKISIVADQSEYALPWGTSTIHDSIPQLSKLVDIQIKYPNSNGYVKATQMVFDWIEVDLKRLETEMSVSNPKFMFNDGNIVIYPTPLEDVTDWIIIDYITKTPDVAIDATEDEISIPWRHHDVLQLWVEWKIHKARRKLEEASLTKAEYEKARQMMIRKMLDRYLQPITVKERYDTSLMY